jgi:hypothetical protein
MKKRKENKELLLFFLLKVNDKLKQSATLLLNQSQYEGNTKSFLRCWQLWWKKNTMLSSWTDFDFSIFFLSNIHKRNPKQKGSEQPKLKLNFWTYFELAVNLWRIVLGDCCIVVRLLCESWVWNTWSLEKVAF